MKNRLFPFQGWRLTFFQGVIFAVFLLFSVRLYQLQVLETADWNAEANENRLSTLPLAASRGAIRDRYDTRLAYNVPAYNVTIVPAALPANEQEELAVFNRLSALVGVPPTRESAVQSGENVRSIEELVIEGEGIAPFRPVVVAQDVPQRVMMQLLEERSLYLPGVDIQEVGVREYPTGATTAHLVGYLGPIAEEEAEELREQGYNPAFDRIGYEGVESYLEGQLSGTRGSELREVDVAGEVLDIVQQTLPIPGQSVRLTIDYELQASVEQYLQDALNNRNNPEYYQRNGRTMPRGLSTQGVVIAMNPTTGEILAMVSLPTYDNSRFARAIDVEYYFDIIEDPARPLVNNAIKGLYPPGSVWKLITAAAVSEEDVIRPEQELLAEGQLIVENQYAPNDPAASQRFVCWLREGHGLVNLIESIAFSCDIYFYQVGGGNEDLSEQVLRQGGLGINDLFRYSTATGIGATLGVELPFEVAGRMPDPDWKRRNYGERWSTGDTYNAAFGQGYVTVTPLQLLAQVNTIINGGTLHQPTIIRELFDRDGNIIDPFQPQTLRTVNPNRVPSDEPLTLLMLEDMLMKGPSSLACVCESGSDWYDPNRCDPEGYRNVVNVSDTFDPVYREYKVHLPINYNFAFSRVCQPVRFTSAADPYRPAFLTEEALRLTQEGMRAAVTFEGGTARSAVLDGYDITVAGKTGTAEYCDDIAQPLGYCVPGQWPSHAWYSGYAPYENPEISVIAFVYNGGEGSFTALPLVKKTMERYFELKEQRGEPLPTSDPNRTASGSNAINNTDSTEGDTPLGTANQ